MKKKLFSIAILLLLFTFGFSTQTVMGAESPTCDEGPINNVEIKIHRFWFQRPDSRIDNNPTASYLGPFQVRARLTSSDITLVVLYYSIAGEENIPVPMTIDASMVYGEIPRISHLEYGGYHLRFYLKAFNANGDEMWIEEIPYTCGQIGGDPYHIDILYSPFDGTWKKVAHTPRDMYLRINGYSVSSPELGFIRNYVIFYPFYVWREYAEHVDWFIIQSNSHEYEYDSATGLLYVYGGPLSGTYEKVSRR